MRETSGSGRRFKAGFAAVVLVAACAWLAPSAIAAPTRCQGGPGVGPNTIAALNHGVEKALTTTCDGDNWYYYRLSDTSSNGQCIRTVHENPAGVGTTCAGSLDHSYPGDGTSNIKVCDVASNGVLTNCSGNHLNWGY